METLQTTLYSVRWQVKKPNLLDYDTVILQPTNLYTRWIIRTSPLDYETETLQTILNSARWQEMPSPLDYDTEIYRLTSTRHDER